jgi:hypothetical protein
MKEQYNRPTEKRESGQQKLGDGQGSATRSMWVNLIGRWSITELADGEASNNQGIRQREDMLEASQSMIGNGSRVSFRRV